MSSDLSGEITAIATAVLALFAIVTAWYARKAFSKQSEEVGILIEDGNRQAAERRKGQAALIFIGIPTGDHLVSQIYVINASHAPVYDVQTWQFEQHGPEGPKDLGVIMPGEKALAADSVVAAGTRTFLTFRDSAGVRWMRVPVGGLREQSRATPKDSILAVARTEKGWVVLTDETS